jgi:PAS domain S-box-containing protein
MKNGFAGAPQLIAPRPPSWLRFVLAALLVTVALVALALWVDVQSRETDKARAMSRASYDRRFALTELLANMAKAETSQRGYVLTGDRQFLVPYAPARLEVTKQLAQLDELFVGRRSQQPRIDALRGVLDLKFAEMARVTAARDAGGIDAAVALVREGRGRRLMESADTIVSAMIGDERKAFVATIATSRERLADQQRLVWVLAVAFAIAVATALALLWQSHRRNYLSELEAYDVSLRLRAIFESITDGVVILDEAGRIDAVNDAVTRMLGYDPGDLIGRPAWVVFNVADGDGSMFDRIGAGGRVGPLGEPASGDQVVHHKQGHDVPVDIAFGHMSLADGAHMVATIRDISERKEIERLKDEFVSTVSHELRTPLTSVVGSLGLLRGGAVGELQDAARRLVEIAENNSRRLIRLINDILDFEKIGSGRMRFDRERIDMRPLLERAVEGSRGLAATQDVRLETTVGMASTFVEGDAERLLQVVTNLLSNAIRYSPPEGRVLLSLVSENGRATVLVDDQGPGVPPEFHDRIFKRFSQAAGDGTAPAGGTGLGLAISREIVRAHGGEIWFGDAPGGGARFAFSLGEVAAPTPSVRLAEQPRILVCEDDAEAADVLKRMIETEGCLVDSVGTIREAQALARSGRYDALVLDLHLPDARGLEAVRVLRADASTRGLPVIVVSAFARDGREDPAAIALDVIDWLDKPVDHRRLLDAVKIAIGRSSAARPTLLHIDDDPDMLEVTATALADQGRMLRATTVAEARQVLATQTPDIVILDLSLPDGNGAELLPEMITVDGIAIPTIIYSAQDATPELGRRVEAIFVKSRRSLPNLAGTIRRILAERPGEP